MAKKTSTVKMTKKAEKNTVLENLKEKENNVSLFVTMTSSELLARYNANVAERNRLSEENKEIIGLYKTAKAQEKSNSTEAKIQALTARLEKLQNPKVK
jgi:ubiquinone biosynthesis protein UbiJ